MVRFKMHDNGHDNKFSNITEEVVQNGGKVLDVVVVDGLSSNQVHKLFHLLNTLEREKEMAVTAAILRERLRIAAGGSVFTDTSNTNGKTAKEADLYTR